MSTPLISVIIPVYNVEKHLRRCLDSVIAQTYQKLEIICVDDGSIDDSGKICDQYAVRDARIKVIHQENQGLSAARNRGIDAADGEYIAFVDSDDYILEDMFERLYIALTCFNTMYVTCGFNAVDPDGKILDAHAVDEVQKYTGEEALYRHYFHPNGAENYVTAWGKLYSKTLFSELRFKRGICFEDIQMMPYLLLRAKDVVLIPYVGYNYVQNNGSIMNIQEKAHQEALYKNAFEIWTEHLELYENCARRDLKTAVYCACISKVIAHSLSDSIPADMRRTSLQMAKKYAKKLSWRRIPPLKQKIYYGLFCLLGPSKFKKLVKLRKLRASKEK